jgi:hypothetical protein
MERSFCFVLAARGNQHIFQTDGVVLPTHVTDHQFPKPGNRFMGNIIYNQTGNDLCNEVFPGDQPRENE